MILGYCIALNNSFTHEGNILDKSGIVHNAITKYPTYERRVEWSKMLTGYDDEFNFKTT